MSDDQAKVVERLKTMAENLVETCEGDRNTLTAGLSIIEWLSAENAALKAEVARLTPKPMAMPDAAKIMRDQAFGGVVDWYVTDDVNHGRCVFFCHQYYPEKVAVYIAQGLLRDAGPFVVQEPAQGNEDRP